MKKMVKRTSCIWMCILYCLLLSSLLTHHAFAEYPEIKIDPSTGDSYDFGAQTIYIYDYWTTNTERKPNPTEEEQALYDYQDWIERTYNCKVQQVAKGDWGSNASELINFFKQKNSSELCLFILPSDFVGQVLQSNAAASWNLLNSTVVEGKWNQNALELMTQGGSVYGVSVGYSEPSQCLYFNKRVLEEAGIDWNTIYDMQANQTWTWTIFENMLRQIQRDTDYDGLLDIYGMTGSFVDLYRMAVFSNGGSFFDSDEHGNMSITAGSDNTLEALAWAKDVWNSYGYQQPYDGSWDYYKDAWKQGFCGFYMYQAYGGFDDNSEMADMTDEWGCVAFPIGPDGETYVNIFSEDITIIPNVYDQATTDKIAFIYDLWTNPPPGYDDKNAWIGNKYNYTDERAVDETYAMLRESVHCVVDKGILLGSVSDIEGVDFLWNLGGSTPAELLESKLSVWKNECDQYNSNLYKPYNIYQWSDDYHMLTGTVYEHDGTIKLTETIENITETITEPTCEEKGYITYQSGEFEYSGFQPQSIKVENADALGHTEVIDEAVPPTCMEVGKTEGSHCSVCGKILVEPEEVPVIEHQYELDKETAATCTEPALSAGFHCPMCGKVFVAQQETAPALGHDWGNLQYAWSDENQAVVYAHVCKRDKSHLDIQRSLHTLVLPAQTRTVGEEAFAGLRSAEAVYLPETVSFIAADAFDHSMIIAAPEGSYALEWAQKKGFEYIAVRTTDQ